jgi:hypothetical protein
MDTLRQGSFIVVRQFGNTAIVRRLWSWDHLGVWVHDEKQFALRVRGEAYYDPILFLWDDAYALPTELAVSEVEGKSIDSITLTPLGEVFNLAISA